MQGRKKRKVRMNQILYAVLLSASAIYVSFRGGAFSYTLFYFLLIYPMVSILYLMLCRAGIRIDQDLTLRELKKYKEEPYHLVIENAGFLPIIGICLFSERTKFREDMTGQEFSLSPGERKCYDTGITCSLAGSYKIGITRLVFSDCFGILHLTMYVKAPLRVQVLPALTGDCSQDVDRALRELIQGVYAGGKTETENTLGNDMAAYSPGDPVKRIHWKNYARSGELFVRLPEAHPRQMIAVVLFCRPEKDSEEQLRRRDEFIEYSLSVASVFVAEKRPVQFLFYNAGVKRISVEDYEGLNKLCFEVTKELVLRGNIEESDAGLKLAASALLCPGFAIEEGVCRLCPM